MHGRIFTNERLEMMGKKVLNLTTTEYLMANENTHGLTFEEIEYLRKAYFGTHQLSKLAERIGLPKYVLWTATTNGKEKIFGKAFCALVGAIYVDLGSVQTKQFLDKHLFANINVDASVVEYLTDSPKSVFMETLKVNKINPSQIKSIVVNNNSSGSEISNHFTLTPHEVHTVALYIGKNKVGEGSSTKSIAAAETKAIRDALLIRFKDTRYKGSVEQLDYEENQISFL
ncbi:Ribonuclease 3 [Zancudomyces culisetae]|uniref:Ribonuclease 3 n=1 Tax=Zancudomyces culisetae TaxID=1213189 RepID=A0A1R1PRI6_ZANCU|nr:Ribonuclease 3 [Zancudomyces culisetae]|eukprot:OMH83492.1 Ribonuclease 3 [Zancudomyces culisetae]